MRAISLTRNTLNGKPSFSMRWVEPAVACPREVRRTKPRSGGIFIAWGVSPRITVGKNTLAAKRRKTIGR